MTAHRADPYVAALGRGVALGSVAAIVVGAVTLAAGIGLGRGQATLAALAASWLFFAGIAAGGVALAATVRLSRGRWAGGAERTAEAGAGFFPVALALLAVLVLAARGWIPGATEQGWPEWWVRAVRDVGAAVVLFGVGAHFTKKSRNAAPDTTLNGLAVLYLVLYAGVLSLWAVDLVMDLETWTPSTVVPPFVFIGAFLGAIAATTLVTALRGDGSPGLRHDLGKLLFAMVILWGYLLWAAYLPVWYGNIPDETGQLLERWRNGWWALTLAVLVAVLVFPFFFLLSERVKRGRVTLAAVAVSILCGLLGERFLLIFPGLHLGGISGAGVPALLAVGVSAGVSGLFVLTAGARLGPAPLARGR